MRSVLVVAALMMTAGAAMDAVASYMSMTPAVAHPAPATMLSDDSAGVRRVMISRNGRGHFGTEGQIGGQRLAFMVDTGASVVALNASSAARAGIHLSQDNYDTPVRTANGVVKAARTHLERVKVGDLVVDDVDAMVLPNDALSENLLGLSFLSKLKRFELASGRMILEQ